MGKIHVLSDSLINRIAAGEVVERPASVVKELLENSLDAGARSIRIGLGGGGKRRIHIADDGSGMDRDDALLAVERHATSKVGSAADLEAIGTLGFRGEALSSIAAVSRFVLSTSTSDGSGTEIEVRGGRISSVREVGLPRGTTILVERLFYNVPARRKFARSDATELSHATKIVTRYALAYPELRFELEQGGRALVKAEPTDGLSARVAQIYGKDLADKMLAFDLGTQGLRVHGLAGRPSQALPRRDAQHVFVNRRAVQDRVLSHAISDAYTNTMPRGRYAPLFLFLEIDPSEVDVNVHPQKHEVRFRHSSQVHDLVRDGLRTTLSKAAVVPSYSDLRPEGELPTRMQDVARAALDYVERHDGARPPATPAPTFRPAPVPAASEPRPPMPARTDLLDEMHAMQVETELPKRQATALAQFRESYILAQDGQGLVIIDQHAAHERVLFERYMADAAENEVEVQQLLFPVTFEVSPSEAILIEEEADELRRLGFRVEPFGERTVKLDAVPAVAANLDPEQLLRSLIGEASEARTASADVAEIRRKVVTSASCQAAIKVNYPLNLEAMQQLLDDLYATVNLSTCPHGRPALFRLTLEEMERAFRRR